MNKTVDNKTNVLQLLSDALLSNDNVIEFYTMIFVRLFGITSGIVAGLCLQWTAMRNSQKCFRQKILVLIA